MDKIHFSYSSINLLYTASHNWINKQLGIKQEDKPYFTAGKHGHQIIQDHVSGKCKDARIDYIKDYFPIVERYDFDPQCKFSFDVDGYDFIGFFDGKNYEDKKSLEIKLSGTPWTLKKFQDLMQRKIYSIAQPDFTEAILLTGSLKPDDWATTRLKRYAVELTERDRKDALEWIRGGLQIFESGDFSGGLTDGVCLNPRCNWGSNCSFKLG